MTDHQPNPAATAAVATLASRLAVALAGLQVRGSTGALPYIVTNPLRSALAEVDAVSARVGDVLYDGTAGANLSGAVEDLLVSVQHGDKLASIAHSVESAIDLISDGDHADAQVVLRDVVHTLKNLTGE